MKRSSLLVFVVAALVGCKRPAPRADPVVTAPAETQTRVAPVAPVASSEWPAIPTLDATRAPAKPVRFPVGSKDKRFVVFAASWCHACVASVPGDAELARRYAGRVEVAVALQEKTSSFASTPMARWLSGVRVYDEDSTNALAKTCGVFGIPFACLLDGDRPLWTGSPDDGVAVLDGFLAGDLEAVRSRQKQADVAWKGAVESPDKRPAAVAALHGFAGRENSIAWRLVDKVDPSPNELGLAVELARDAVDSTGALDFALLDTYEVGLSKSGDAAGAARAARRVIAVCDAVKGECSEERSRAEAVLAQNP